jgi:hypothetical protein
MLRKSILALGALLCACQTQPSRQSPASAPVVSLGDLQHLETPQLRSTVVFTTRAYDSLPLGRFVDARFLPDSTLVISRETDLLVFSPTGELLRRLGRGGDGPGEYSRAWRLGIADDGTLLVGDFWNGRVTLLAPPRLRTIPFLGSPAPSYEMEPLALLSDKRILATYWQRRPNRDEPGLRVRGVERDSAPLLLFDSTGTFQRHLATWPGLERSRVLVAGEPGRLPPPYAQTTLTQGRGSFVAVTTTDSLDLSLYEDTLVALRLTGHGVTRAPTPADLETWKEGVRADLPDVAPLYLAAVAQARPERRPLLTGLGLGEGGELWLGLAPEPTDTTQRWLLVSQTGKLVAGVDLPTSGTHALPGFRDLLDVAGRRVALFRETPEGEPYVEVRAVHP